MKLAVTLLTLLTAIGSAHADLIRVDFTGQVTSSDVETANGAVTIGDPVSGYLLFDNTTPDIAAAADFGRFTAIISARLETGLNVYERLTPGSDIDIIYTPSPTDQTGLSMFGAANLGPATVGGANPVGFRLQGLTNAGQPFDVNVLPDLATLNAFFADRLPGANGYMRFSTKDAPQFNFDLTSISASLVVPEPASLVLIMLGVPLLTRRRCDPI